MQADPDALKAIPLFSDLSGTDRETIASWLDVRDVAEGTRVTPEGAFGYDFFLIESGTADVVHDGVVIASMGPGDVFGEAAIMGDGRRTADVVATSAMTLFEMFGVQFREMEMAFPELAARIGATLRERLSSDTHALQDD